MGKKDQKKKDGIDEEFVKKGAQNIDEEDVQKVLDREKEIKDKFKKKGPLGRFIEDVKLLFSLVGDYWNGNYREIPWWAMSAIVFALLYVFNPVDFIPDFIPFVGYVDDAAVVGLCLNLVEKELHKYNEWKIAAEGAQSSD